MTQQTKASINLGNETHARGFNDGLNGRPKTIKKTHVHAHRYHIGYRLGQAEAKTTMRAALSHNDNGVQTRNYVGEAVVSPPVKRGFLSRIMAWVRL